MRPSLSILAALITVFQCFAVPTAQAFGFCFAYTHGRCFESVQTSAKLIKLRQYGGLSDSEARIAAANLKALEKDITTFFAAVAYASAKKKTTCAKPLIFKTAAQENIRCLERLKQKDSEMLLSLVSKISLASKP